MESKKQAESEPSKETESTSEAPKKSRVPFNWRLADYIFRALFVAAIVYMCWGLVSSVIFSERKTPKRSEVAEAADADLLAISTSDNASPYLFMSDFMQGNWSFGGADWDFSSREMTQLPTDEELDRPPTQLRDYDARFEDKKIIEIFTGLGAEKEKAGELLVWRLTFGGIRARLFAHDSSHGELVQLVRIALPQDQKFSLMQGIPITAKTQQPARELMPVPDNVEQIATRTNDNEIVTSAILEIVSGKIDIVEFWKQNGWQVRSDSTAGHVSGTQFRCIKDNIVVVATFLPNPDLKKTSILLVRVPDSNQ